MKVGIRERKTDDKKPTRFYSDKQEKTVATNLAGHQTISSGSTPFSKGDVLLEDFLIECKTKTSHSQSITVKKEWIEKNKSEALFMGKEYSVVTISFGPDEENYYILDENLFKELVEYLNYKNKCNSLDK